jgi:hypothetical protein
MGDMSPVLTRPSEASMVSLLVTVGLKARSGAAALKTGRPLFCRRN